MRPMTLFPPLLLILAACDGGSPHFMGIDPQYALRMGPIGARAARAMEQVSGCAVREVRGDQALILGILDC